MKKCLIVVDMQQDFIDGALGFKEALDVTSPVAAKIQAYKDAGDRVVFTFDTHSKNYLDTEEGRWLPVPHVIEGTKGHDLHPLINDLKAWDDPIFEKDTFGSLALGNYLAETGFDEVELCGLVSSMCVISNAIIAKAALPFARIRVDAKATRSFDPQMHHNALALMTHLHIHVDKE